MYLRGQRMGHTINGQRHLAHTKQIQQTTARFRYIKRYGIVFNHTWLRLQALIGETPGACVLEAELQLYSTPEEIGPGNRFALLNMNIVVEQLKMATIDEGCSIAQLAVFCDTHTIAYYVLDVKYTLFETNNPKWHSSDVPCLVFVCANIHLYPVIDTEKRGTISNMCSAIGGTLNTYKTQQPCDISQACIQWHIEELGSVTRYVMLRVVRYVWKRSTSWCTKSYI